MYFNTRGMLKSAGFSGLILFSLILSACSSSDDTASEQANISPVAVDDSYSLVKGSTTTLDLTANDSDADDGLDLATITIATAPVSGSVVVNPDGTVSYTHDCSDTVSDQFTYTIKDNSGAVSNTATVSLTITAPVATPEIGIYDSTVVEGADDLEFVVSLSSVSDKTISVDFETIDGTATEGEDYVATAGTLTFACGEVRKTVPIFVNSNSNPVSGTSENMQLLLSNPQNAELNVSAGMGTGVIVDSNTMSMDEAFDHNWGTAGIFTNAVECSDCHQSDGSIMQYTNPDVSLATDDIGASDQWKHTVMANSFNDPYWQAAVQDESESFPDLSGFIEDTCTTCHAPMGRTHAHHQDPDTEYRFDTAKAEDHAREGVSCTACHLMKENGTFSGGYVISDTDKDIYGQYDNPLVGPMSNTTNGTTLGYIPVKGAHVQSSAFCATCHTLYTPALDPATGLPSGPNTGLPSADKGFLEQGPYLEWQNSDYATAAQPVHCQDCHMPVPSEDYSTRISTRPFGNQLQTRGDYAQHTLVGGNAHLLEILRDYSAELGIEGSTDPGGFNDQIALTQHFLSGAADLDVSDAHEVDANLEFDVEVTNNAGHKIPSAYPSRRTWLHVTVKDGSGIVIFESGKPDDRGYISTDEARLKADCMSKDKLDGFDSSVCYEPHRDVIADPTQVAIYETVLGDINGNITHTLLQGAQYLKDNRIPPIGFENENATEVQTIPAGVSGDNNFNCGIDTPTEGCGKDTVHYQVDIEGNTGPYSVEARLLYQATQPGFVDGMHTDGDRVNRFKVMYDAIPPTVEILATATSP
jgi:hypothetical protein